MSNVTPRDNNFNYDSSQNLDPLKISQELKEHSENLLNISSKEISNRIDDLKTKVGQEPYQGFWSLGTPKKRSLKSDIKRLETTKKAIHELQNKLNTSNSGEKGIRQIEDISKKTEIMANKIFGNIPLSDVSSNSSESGSFALVLEKISSSDRQLHIAYKQRINEVVDLATSTSKLLLSLPVVGKGDNRKQALQNKLKDLKSQIEKIKKENKSDKELVTKDALQLCESIKGQLNQIKQASEVIEVQNSITTSNLPPKLQNHWQLQILAFSKGRSESFKTIEDLKNTFNLVIEGFEALKATMEVFFTEISKPDEKTKIDQDLNNITTQSELNEFIEFAKDPEGYSKKVDGLVKNLEQKLQRLPSGELEFSYNKEFQILIRNLYRQREEGIHKFPSLDIVKAMVALERLNESFDKNFAKLEGVNVVLADIDTKFKEINEVLVDNKGNELKETRTMLNESNLELNRRRNKLLQRRKEIAIKLKSAKTSLEFDEIKLLCNQISSDVNDIHKIGQVLKNTNILLNQALEQLAKSLSQYPKEAVNQLNRFLKSRAALVTTAAQKGGESFYTSLAKFNDELNVLTEIYSSRTSRMMTWLSNEKVFLMDKQGKRFGKNNETDKKNNYKELDRALNKSLDEEEISAAFDNFLLKGSQRQTSTQQFKPRQDRAGSVTDSVTDDKPHTRRF